MKLEELFKEAEKYGRVSIHGEAGEAPPKCYSCAITFNTIDHVELKARSGFSLTVENALIGAIRKAVIIVETVSRGVSEDEIRKKKKLIGFD